MPRQISISLPIPAQRQQHQHQHLPLPPPHYHGGGGHHPPHYPQEHGEDDGHGHHYQYTQAHHRHHQPDPHGHGPHTYHPPHHHAQHPHGGHARYGDGGVYLHHAAAGGIGRSLSNLADAAEASANEPYRGANGQRGFPLPPNPTQRDQHQYNYNSHGHGPRDRSEESVPLPSRKRRAYEPPPHGHPPPQHEQQQSQQQQQQQQQQHQKQHQWGEKVAGSASSHGEAATVADFQPRDDNGEGHNNHEYKGAAAKETSPTDGRPRGLPAHKDPRQEEENRRRRNDSRTPLTKDAADNDGASGDGCERQEGRQSAGGHDERFLPPPPNPQKHRHYSEQHHPDVDSKSQPSNGGMANKGPGSWENSGAAPSQHRPQHHPHNLHGHQRRENEANCNGDPNGGGIAYSLPYPYHQHHYPYYHHPSQQQHYPYPASPHSPHPDPHDQHQPLPPPPHHNGAHPPPHPRDAAEHPHSHSVAGEGDWKRPLPPDSHLHPDRPEHRGGGHPPHAAHGGDRAPHGRYGVPPPHGPPHPPPPPPTEASAAKRDGLRPLPRGHPRGHPQGGYAPPVAGLGHAVPPDCGGDCAPMTDRPLRPDRAKAAAATADLHEYHLPKSHVLPVYKYSTLHQGKSWDEMIALFKQYVEREGHGDLEKEDRDMMVKALEASNRMEEDAEREGSAVGIMVHLGKPTNNQENAGDKSGKGTASNADQPPKSIKSSNPEKENEKALMLRSWVREVRWVIRAEGLGQEDKLPRSMAAGGGKGKKVQRCDSETVTPERLTQLEEMPDFPLRRNNHKSSKDDGGNIESTGNQQHPNQHSSAFGRWLDDLMHYRAKNDGCCNVPLKYAEYPGLGNFVNRQRTEYRKLVQGKASSMTRTKVRQLDLVAFTWSVREGGHTLWETRFDELRAYQRAYGHTNVPKNYLPNPSLGYWVNEQRFQYRRWTRGQTSYMNANRMSQLNSVGFKWTLRESKRPWKEWMEELRKYKAEHGHVTVPLKYAQNVPLGSFVNNTRSEYRRMRQGKPSSMTEEKVQELEEMGFLWNVREARMPWNVRLEELRQYKKKYGNCNVPNTNEHQSLSAWVSKQRQQYKLFSRRVGAGSASSQLSDERVEQLNELGFDWRYPLAVVPTNAFVPPPAADGSITEPPPLPPLAATAANAVPSAAVTQV